MTEKNKLCIYCGNTNNPDFKGREHVLPQSFGTFGSKTPTLNCVCDKCNDFFKKELDQILARETLEGITRYKKGIFSREMRSQKGMHFSLGEGEETGEFAGVLIGGVDGKTGKLLPPISQFHVLNKKTGEWDKFTKEQIKDLRLSEDIYGKGGERQCKIFAPSSEEHDAVVEELKRAGIPYREHERFQPEFLKDKKDSDKIELPVEVRGVIDKVRKRALAKILFNFAAYYLGADEVLKSQWDKVRQFIRFDGETIKGRFTNKLFWTGQETDNLRFAGDSYNIRIENQNGNVVGVIQLYNLFTYEFILIENYSVPQEKEIAYRFTPGQEPHLGVKMSEPMIGLL